jgi:1-acyl-sn-glycerol-3-phosphate acyltransferase
MSLKVCLLISVLLLHAVLAIPGKIVFLLKKRTGILYLANINRIICILLSGILTVHVKSQKAKIHNKNAVVYVGNHLSYLDVLAIGSCYPTIFVTSVDMGEHKSEGWITSNAGSIYVERRREKLRMDELKKNIESMRTIVLNGCPLCIFPEATSANSDPELQFFSSLFSAVEYTETTVVPFAVKYTSIDREPLTEANRGIIYFYKGERFVPHIKKLLKHKDIEVEITILPGFSAQAKNRKEICNDCKTMIATELANPATGFGSCLPI